MDSTDVAPTAPPLHRGAMTPPPWFGFWRGLLFALWPGQRLSLPADAAARRPWHAAARRRRAVLLAAVLSLAGLAAALRVDGRPPEPDALWWANTALMTLLFAWVGSGFATALMGAWASWRGDRLGLRLHSPGAPIDPRARTAIVMPICNEDIGAVFAGLRATCESLATTGALQLFDVFVLSDTADPRLRAAEEQAWRRLCDMLGVPADGSGRVFYRWRQRRVKRKAGNVADFCRRWGRNYRYMVVLDADSTMSGTTLVQLVRLMEEQPRAGIIQTLPQVASPVTLHARAQQFASRVSGRLFARGMAWWQLGDAHYWGHNAILRVEPFMRHCGLARLPGRGGQGTEILSHDFVEAALMGRMGYDVWLAPDLGGSWEQVPANLLDELQRDRRWCQGNMQNLRLVAEPGWRGAHRAMFAVGAFSYAVAPLWLVFMALGLGASGAVQGTSDTPLWLLTLLLLLLPRVLGTGMVVVRGEAAAFGGKGRLVLGALLELALTSMQAPLRMLAHCVYVLGALTGFKLEWKSPPRASLAPGWADSARRIGSLVLLPVAASIGLARRTATVALAPMLLPLAMAVPFVVFTGHPRAGRLVQRLGLLRTPEGHAPPRPLVRAAECAAFRDLMPAPLPVAAGTAPAPPRRPLRLATGSLLAATAVFALLLPRPVVSPELLQGPERQPRVVVEMSRTPVSFESTDKPAPKKRVVRPERPARMIDDALRQRAYEFVQQAVGAEEGGSPA